MFMAICIFSSANAANWIWIFSNEDKTIWVDNNSIRSGKYNSHYDFSAFMKYTYSQSGSRKRISQLNDAGVRDISSETCLIFFVKKNNIKFT